MDGIENVLSRFSDAGPDSLIPILQDVQEDQGFLSPDSLAQIGEHLGISTSAVYGVATFYNQFRFHPLGKYPITICRGTACHVKGSSTILEALKTELEIEPGQTTEDGLFSIEIVACIGACGLAPVILIGDETYAAMTPSKARKLINKYRKRAKS